MSNPFYNVSGAPVTGAPGASATIRSEFSSIASAFDKLPGTLTANKAVVINAGGTAMTITTGGLALAGDFSTTGAFNTVFAQQASITITLPLTADTLVGRATTDTLTNKTLTAPVMTAPVLGTPASGVLTNCTGYLLANITGFGAGVATFLATPTSANLAAAVTGETGTGALVFATSPALVTPALGVATATTLAIGGATIGANGLAVTGTSLFNNTITVGGTGGGTFDGSVLTVKGFGNTATFGSSGWSTNDGNPSSFVNTSGGSISVISGGGGVILNVNATVWAAISDHRAKTIYGRFTNSGEIIDAAPVHLASRNDIPGNVKKAMFVAHELQIAVPYAVRGEKDAVDGEGKPIFQNIESTDPLVPILWAEVQSLRARLAAGGF